LTLWKLVIKEAFQRGWRLVASLVALVLATGLIVTILSLNSSSRKAMHGYMKNLGANMVVIPAELDLLTYYSADPNYLKRVDLLESHFFRLIERQIPGVEGIDPRLTVPVDIGGVRGLLTGILPDRMLRPEVGEAGGEDHWEVLNSLTPESDRAVLGAELKRLLNQEMGAAMEVAGNSLKVVGILPEQGTVDDIRIYVHLRTIQKWLERPFSLNEIRVLYTGKKAIEKVASGIEGILENTRVVTHSRMARKQIQTMDSIREYALALLVVTLILGSISIGNEMFHNAHARKREIGILTALGATTRTILTIFIMKAFFLALVGGLLGYGVGSLVAFILAPRFLHLQAYPSLSLIPVAILTAVVLGVLSSAAPSWRASRMDPGEILQE
jgi:putative ABC transport system permease protein